MGEAERALDMVMERQETKRREIWQMQFRVILDGV
jgi:hypothetical protein